MLKDTALARKVYDFLTDNPELHSQEDWAVKDTPCGTVACIAGTTVILAGCELVFEPSWSASRGASPSYPVQELVWVMTDGLREEVDEVAARLLGLSQQEAYLLFFSFTQESSLVRLSDLIDQAEEHSSSR